MKKVLIFYGSYGGGHLSAAKSIKDYIDTNYQDVETYLVDCIEYVNKIFNKVTTKAYSEMAKNAHWVWKKVYYAKDKGLFIKVNNTTQKLMSIKLNKLLQDYKPNLIISTHPFGSHMSAILKKQKKINSKIATIITDYTVHSQWLVLPAYIDYFFIAHDKMKKVLLEKGVQENQIKVTGIPISNKFLIKYNKETILPQLGLSANKKTILFFAGGEQGFGKYQILNILKLIIENFPNIQIIAIAGKNKKIKKDFNELVKAKNATNTVKVLSYTNKIPELMGSSDLVITKPGGLTITESLVSRTPNNSSQPYPWSRRKKCKLFSNKWSCNLDRKT